MIDDDRLLDVVGVVLVVFIVLAIAVLALAGATAPEWTTPEEPAVNWTIERTGPAGVAITHAGGEPVDASELVVAVAGIERSPGRSDVMTEGDSIQASARPGQSVELYWESSRDERVLLAEWEAPE